MQKFMKYLIIGLIAISLFLFLLKYFPLYEKKITAVNISLKNTYLVTLATDLQDRVKGLSGINYMNENEGMLFIFPTTTNTSFWMKDMKFPLDIIYIDQDLKIVEIMENLQPCREECKTYTPKLYYKYVLEVNAGQSEVHKFEVGDDVSFLH